MTKLLGVLSVVLVILLAMGFAAANAGHRVTLSLGFVIFYQVPVTLVAFAGVLAGMVVMFATGIHSDLKVRQILRDRLADESRREQRWIDRDQVDLFAGEGSPGPPPSEDGGAGPREADGTTGPEAGDPPVVDSDEEPRKE